ncbi:TELO2-interacting protein 1 homolog [Mantella aurantiaca]
MEAVPIKACVHDAFQKLRPFCVKLMKEQTVQNVQNLRQQISSIDKLALQDLLDYILFPLRYSLKTNGPSKPGLTQVILECISYILTLTYIKSPDTLKEMFDEICSCLPPDFYKSVPEELKMAIVLAMQSLLRSSGANALPVLYTPSVLPEMGFTITLILSLAETEKSRELRLEALQCLECLLFPEVKMADSLGDLFASFLPGVCTILTKLACGDPKQGYRLKAATINLWTAIVSLVMSDESLEKVPKKKPRYPGLSDRVADLMTHRDKTWVDLTAGRLKHQLQKIAEHSTADPHWKVRLALVDLGYVTIRSCWYSLEIALSSLIRIIVGHVNDDRPEVKEKAREALLEVGQDESTSKTLGEVLAESLHGITVTLPRLLSSEDDQVKLHVTTLLLGYFQLLGPRLTFTLYSSAHLQRISYALLQTLELDLCSIKVVEERLPSSLTNLTQENIEHTEPLQKTFRFFRDQRILYYLLHNCRILGYYGDFNLLTDHFLGFYRGKRLSAIIVLNQLILGAAGIDVETPQGGKKGLEAVEFLDAMRPILEEYTDPANWHLCTCQNTPDVVDQMALLSVDQKPNSAISDWSANAWKLCLQLEGIACIAQALGTNFRQLLIIALYPLLEKAGDPSLMVSGTALVTLAKVSQACGYKDIKQLVELNADYLASEVSVGLRRLQRHHGSAARVLHAILDHCSPSLLPLLYELVQDLLPALDQSQNEGAKILFPVLNCLVIRLGKWFPPQGSTEDPPVACMSDESQVHCGNMAQEIKSFLQGHMEEYRLARGELEEDDFADASPPPDEAKDEEKLPLPIHVKISKEVAEKCTHYLSHGDHQIRVQALDTLRLSLLPLQSKEDVLLPLAHKIWPCLVKRLLLDEPLVLLRAFQLLVSLASSCKDFLRQRVCKEAFPVFLTSLRSQALVSSNALPIYSHMLGYKLQLAILEGFGSLCVDLALGDNDLLEVIDSCMLYLSVRQPKKLQEAAVRTLLNLSQLDPDIVWLYLCKWQSPPKTPHPSLVPLPWKDKNNDEYTQNVDHLLQMMQ